MTTKRFFNTTGPCNPDDHYMLKPEERLVGAQLHRYIRNKLYWVLHAPRQMGKTTFLQSWVREINDSDEAVACYVISPKPLIVLFDEVDVLQGEAMISFLRQLRDGFTERGIGKFPISIALVGMRDLKDYITASKGGLAPNPGSPFNIKEDSAVLSNFSREDVARLFALRTAETPGRQMEM